MKDHRRELLDRLNALKVEFTNIDGEIDIPGACRQAIREYQNDLPDESEEFMEEAPPELLRVWNNQRNQSKRSAAKQRFGSDVDKAITGEDLDAPTLDGRPDHVILNLEHNVHNEGGRLVSKKLGTMTGPQRRELEDRYGREERSKRQYRRFFSDLNRISDEERDRRGLDDEATLFQIWGVG